MFMLFFGPRGWYQSSEPTEPLFDFPQEAPHQMTAADLMNILRIARINVRNESIWNHSMAAVKASLDGTGDRVRGISRTWPRAPQGQVITPDSSLRGKQAPNGLELWGSTMRDMYHVYRSPEMLNLVTTSTGSKLMAWMKANGETDTCKDEIAYAEMEEDPKVIEPWSPREEIQEMEEMIRRGEAGEPMPSKGKSVSTTSIFDLSRYPDPWPMVPFSYATERLTSIIDRANLPRKLIVHDPCDTLVIDSPDYDPTSNLGDDEVWTSKPDRILTYNLKISDEAPVDPPPDEMELDPASETSSIEDGLTGILNGEEVMVEILDAYYLHPPTTVGPTTPPILVGHKRAPKSSAPTTRKENMPIEEAHLYLWPTHIIGQGHHSFVYHAELELPRSVLIPPSQQFVLCKDCVEEDVNRILKEEDGENGEYMEERWKEESAEVVRVYEGRPPILFSAIHHDEIDKPNPDTYKFISEGSKYHLKYEGPNRWVETGVAWQDRMHPTCQHLSPPAPPPPTVKVRVVAKLSIQDDDHLATEAGNYERFPKHIYEHWSGLNAFAGISDPVPIAPIVPQYYGYYVPEEDESSDSEQGYHSPILLLEDCGQQIAVNGSLTTDQRNEAVSLIFRLHHAGWVHGSVYPRNYLSQPGPLSVPPGERSQDKPSFRLVDFGRSREPESQIPRDVSWVDSRMNEELLIKGIFGVSIV